MYYSLEQLQIFVKVDRDFYEYDEHDLISTLRLLPKELAYKVVYVKIAVLLDSKVIIESNRQLLSKIMIEFKIDPANITQDQLNESLENSDIVTRSMDLLLKSAWLEDGVIDTLSVTKDEYDFLKEDFLKSEKYELIPKLIIS